LFYKGFAGCFLLFGLVFKWLYIFFVFTFNVINDNFLSLNMCRR